MAGLTSSVTQSNHTAWADCKPLTAQAMVGSPVPGLSPPKQTLILNFRALSTFLMHQGNTSVISFYPLKSQPLAPRSTLFPTQHP